MSSVIRSPRAILPALLATILIPVASSAQTARTWTACYVPSVGAMYLVKETGLPTACLATTHVEVTWTDGVVSDGSITAAKLADGSIATAKLSFDPATQVELDAHAHGRTDGGTSVGEGALAAGAPRHATAVGFQALMSNTTGQSNTAVGAQAMRLTTTGGQNTAVGSLALRDNLTGSWNAAVGQNAMQQTTGSFNVAVGGNALVSTSGASNVAIGQASLHNTTSGAFNTALGASTLFANTTGNQNVAVGNLALRNPVTSSLNVAVGEAALLTLSSGGSNTGIGQAALNQLATGSNNTALGRNAGHLLTNGSGNILIGHNGAATMDNTIMIGSTQTRVHLAGVSGVTTDGTAAAVVIDASGQLGTVSSSRRVKKDIEPMGTASSGLMRLRPVTFRYRKPMKDGSQPIQYGLIAEEVAEVYPELVVRDTAGAVQTVSYHALPALLLNELQRQQREIAELRALIEELRATRRR
ncbi:MAG: tail fiber domain-containing protein [Gemmatimonadaceae bacterium]